jgi:ASPM-SPD-2-Hydin domain-containing protein/HYDIN/CFA65/VesB family protein/centrosomal CEP192-like protein/uncharacterized protein DUF1573
MKLTPILEGADVDARLRSRGFSFPIILEIFATIFIVASMLVTSGCVGVTGKPGTSGAGGLSIEVSPSAVNFGSLTVGHSATQTLKITNSGTKSLSVSGISVAGTGFTVKAPALPLSLAAGQAASVPTTFTATASGSASGKIMISSNAPDSPMIVALSATGVAQASNLAVTPASLSFGDVKVGSASTQAVQLKNSGSSSITISAMSVSGSGISVSGLSTPTTLPAGASANLTAVFKPAAAGNASGALTIKSTASDASDAIGWSGTGTSTTSASSAVTATPSSVAFGTVPTGSTTTQTIRLTNSGESQLTVSGVSVTGPGVSVSGITTPLNIAAGQSANLTASLKLTSAGAASGAIKIASNASASPTQISWSATGQTSVVTLTSSPATLSFGSVNLGTAGTLQTTIKNTGNSNANISKISVSGTGFSLNGSTSSATLDPGQSLTVSVTFDPKTAATDTGTLTIASNATTSQLGVALAGTGVNKPSSAQHSVALSWDESSSSVVGYYVYRSSKPSGPYARINSSTTSSTSYSDSTVSDGQVYYYVVTAVNSSNIESTDSNQVSATIPAN